MSDTSMTPKQASALLATYLSASMQKPVSNLDEHQVSVPIDALEVILMAEAQNGTQNDTFSRACEAVEAEIKLARLLYGDPKMASISAEPLQVFLAGRPDIGRAITAAVRGLTQDQKRQDNINALREVLEALDPNIAALLSIDSKAAMVAAHVEPQAHSSQQHSL